MALPSCLCVDGRPPFDRLNDIYCALTQVEIGCTTPVLLSATIDGDQVTLTFSVKVTGFVAGNNGFQMAVAGNSALLSYVGGNGTTTIAISSDVSAEEGDFVLLDYTPGIIANRDCPLAQFVDFPVTNNTGLQFTYVQPDGFAYFQPDVVSLYLQP